MFRPRGQSVMKAAIGGHSLCKDDGKSTLPRAVLYKKLRTAGGASAKRCQPDATVSEFCIRTPNCSEALRSLGRTNQPAALSHPDEARVEAASALTLGPSA